MDNEQKTNETPELAAQSGPACIHDDILTLRNLALQVKAHPHQRAAAEGFEALARVVDDLAHRLDAIEAAEAMRKPCEGCWGEDERQQQALEAAIVAADERSAPESRGALRSALENLGMIKGGA